MNTALEPPRHPPGPLPRLAVAAIFRNEAPYVVEWLAHHRVVGVDAFYIADNASDDGTSELLQALHDLGYLQRIPFPSPPGRAPQLPAYADILGRHAAAEDWVAVIDADEFIMPGQAPYDVRVLLGELAAQSDVGAIALNWAIYGSSWLANHAAGLVIERFTRRAHPSFEPNFHYKTILRMAAFAGQPRNPHHFELKPGWRYVHTNGQEVRFHERHGPGLSEEVVWHGMRLNHYIVKSREEFTTRKQRNGSAASLTRIKDEGYFRAYDCNDTRDPVAHSLTSRVRAEIQEIENALRAAGHAIPSARDASPRYIAPFPRPHGHIDGVQLKGDALHIRGWAFNPSGEPVECLLVKLGTAEITSRDHDRKPRPDVQQHYPMVHSHCGFALILPVGTGAAEIRTVEVFAIDASGDISGPFTGTRATSDTQSA